MILVLIRPRSGNVSERERQNRHKMAIKKSTSDLNREITTHADLKGFLTDNQEEFRGSFMKKILNDAYIRCGLSKAETAERSGMSEVYLHQILSGKRVPSRDRLLCLCIALEMPEGDVNTALKECGYASLYIRNRRDAIILYALNNGWDINVLNDGLFEANEETLF